MPSVGTLGAVQPHWVFVNRGNGQDGTRIFDGDTGRMKGMVNMYGQDSFAFDPLGKEFLRRPDPVDQAGPRHPPGRVAGL